MHFYGALSIPTGSIVLFLVHIRTPMYVPQTLAVYSARNVRQENCTNNIEKVIQCRSFPSFLSSYSAQTCCWAEESLNSWIRERSLITFCFSSSSARCFRDRIRLVGRWRKIDQKRLRSCFLTLEFAFYFFIAGRSRLVSLQRSFYRRIGNSGFFCAESSRKKMRWKSDTISLINSVLWFFSFFSQNRLSFLPQQKFQNLKQKLFRPCRA